MNLRHEEDADSYVCSFSQTSEGRAVFHNTAFKICCKATGINKLCHQLFAQGISSSPLFSSQLTSIFQVIPDSPNCLSAFPQASVYFLLHLARKTLPAENKLPPPFLLQVPPSPSDRWQMHRLLVVCWRHLSPSWEEIAILLFLPSFFCLKPPSPLFLWKQGREKKKKKAIGTKIPSFTFFLSF